MQKGLKIFLGISIPLVVLTGSFFIYKNYRSKKEDDLTIDIGTVDWKNRIVPTTYSINGEIFSKGSDIWRKDLVGKGERDNMSDGKNAFYQTDLSNGMILRGTSMGKQKFAKIIDFNSKTVKDYTGSNVSNDIASASEIVKNLFI